MIPYCYSLIDLRILFTLILFILILFSLYNYSIFSLGILFRIKNILIFQQRKILFKSFFAAQFKYRPLIWMFCSRSANSKINKLHKKALGIVYDDYNSTFEELLMKDGSFTIHHQNIQTLAISEIGRCLKFTMDFHKSLF